MSLDAKTPIDNPFKDGGIRGGLLSVARIIPAEDAHTNIGVVYDREDYTPPVPLDIRPLNDLLSTTGDRVPVSPKGPSQAPSGTAFGLEKTVETMPRWKDSDSEAADYVQRAFERGEPWAVERAFQRGILNPGATVLEGTGAWGPVRAIAALEQYMADNYTAEPIFHVNRFGATYLAAEKLTVGDKGFLLRTRQGSPIANGGGYGPTGPGSVSAAADEFWLYATGAVTIMVKPIEISMGRDLTANEEITSATRMYVPVYAGPVVAIRVGV